MTVIDLSTGDLADAIVTATPESEAPVPSTTTPTAAEPEVTPVTKASQTRKRGAKAGTGAVPVPSPRKSTKKTEPAKAAVKSTKTAKAAGPKADAAPKAEANPVPAGKVRIRLSGKVHTILVTGQSEVGGKPGNLPLPSNFTGWLAKPKYAALAKDLGAGSRSERSKGYVFTFDTTPKAADQLVEVLEGARIHLEDVKGGGYDVTNCRRYITAAQDNINALVDDARK